MTDVDELLRRDGDRWRATASVAPHVEWTALTARRARLSSPWLIVVAATAAAAAIVVGAVPVPSMLHRRATVPAPAHRPTPTPVPHAPGGPASFIALGAGGVTQVDARTGQSRGMAVSEQGRKATALAVTDDGNVGYATYSHPGCQVAVHRYRWTTPTTSEGTDAATVAGRRADAIAVSPDGHLVAVAVQPCSRPKDEVDDLVVVNLDTHVKRRWTGHPDVSFLSGLQWGPDNETLAYVVTPCCGGGSEGPRLLDTAARGPSYVAPAAFPIDETGGSGLVFWFRGELAVIMGSEIHALSTTGTVGPVLARGLPTDTADVHPDSSGGHLLLTTQDRQVLRWDAGVLTPLRGDWIDAGW